MFLSIHYVSSCSPEHLDESLQSSSDSTETLADLSPMKIVTIHTPNCKCKLCIERDLSTTKKTLADSGVIEFIPFIPDERAQSTLPTLPAEGRVRSTLGSQATTSPVSSSSGQNMKEFIRPIAYPLSDHDLVDCLRKVNELVDLMNRILDVHPRLLKELEEERAMKGI